MSELAENYKRATGYYPWETQPGDPPLLTAVLADLRPRHFSAQIEVLDSEELPDGTTLIKDARLLSVGHGR